MADIIPNAGDISVSKSKVNSCLHAIQNTPVEEQRQYAGEMNKMEMTLCVLIGKGEGKIEGEED